LKNLETMGKFLDSHDHLKLKQKDINHQNRSLKCNEIEASIESPKKGKSRI
jgi:hypothetical protein